MAMEWEMKLKESVLYWERRLRRIEGRKDGPRAEIVRRHLRMLKEVEEYERNRS